MNDLDRLWDDVPVGTPDLPAALRAGTRLRRRRQTFGVVVATAVLVLGIGGGTALWPRPDAAPSPVAPDRSTPGAVADRATVYYLLDEPVPEGGFFEPATLLTPREVEVEDTGSPGYDALHALLTLEPPSAGLSVGFNFVGDDPVTDVESVTHEGGVVSVDLSGSLWDPYPAYDLCCTPDGLAVAQQLVHTVQAALGTTDPVEFEGRGIWFEELDAPVEADPDRVVPSEQQVAMAAAQVGARAGSGVDITGRLGFDDGCATLAGRAVLMPRGWTAWGVSGGTVVLDEDGGLVARTGDRVVMNGSVIDGPGPEPCVADGDGLWVTVVSPAGD